MSKKVLLVEDSKTMRDMVTFTLRQAGFNVTEAADGQIAVDAIRGNKFDLIIADINMPVMDGLTLIRKVRAASDHRGVPILILTTESDEAKKVAGKSAGATGWLVKPFNPDKLVNVVNSVLDGLNV